MPDLIITAELGLDESVDFLERDRQVSECSMKRDNLTEVDLIGITIARNCVAFRIRQNVAQINGRTVESYFGRPLFYCGPWIHVDNVSLSNNSQSLELLAP